jgi:hypothetical protein
VKIVRPKCSADHLSISAAAELSAWDKGAGRLLADRSSIQHEVVVLLHDVQPGWACLLRG